MVPLDHTSRSIIAVQIACICVCTTVVVLRFIARFWRGQKISWDDGFMLVAWSTLIAYLYTVIMVTKLGSAQLLTVAIPPQDLISLFKFAYASALIFETTNIAVKVSLLFFYHRIFPLPQFRRQAAVVGAVCAAWYIASILVTVFQCLPIRLAWDKQVPGHCISLDQFVLGYELTNAILDIILILLPVRVIHTLKLSQHQKVLLTSMFLLGGFVCLTSVLRIVYSYNPSNPMHMFREGPIWSSFSIASAVLCGNVPMLKIFFSAAMVPKPIKNLYYYMMTSTSLSKGSKVSMSKDYNEIEASHDDVPLTVGENARKGKKRDVQKDLYPLQSFNTTVGITTVNIDEQPPKSSRS